MAATCLLYRNGEVAEKDFDTARISRGDEAGHVAWGAIILEVKVPCSRAAL